MLDEPSPSKPTTKLAKAVRLRPRDVETKVMGLGSVGGCGWDLGDGVPRTRGCSG